MRKRNTGRFFVPRKDVFENKVYIPQLFTNFVPLSADSKPWRDEIEYVGYHPEFGEVPEDEEAPTYDIVKYQVNRDDESLIMFAGFEKSL